MVLSKGASSRFVRGYKRLMTAINAGDQAAADAELAQLEVNNLFEDAYKHVGRYQYHLEWGTEAQQLADLELAVAGEPLPRYLPDDVFVVAVRSLLGLQLRAKNFGSALKTWETLQNAAPGENHDKLRSRSCEPATPPTASRRRSTREHPGSIGCSRIAFRSRCRADRWPRSS